MAALATVDFFLVTESQHTALQPLAPADGDAAAQCARAALDMLASDEGGGVVEPPQTGAASCSALLGCPLPDADAALHALAHTLASAARLNVTPEALTDKLRSLVRPPHLSCTSAPKSRAALQPPGAGRPHLWRHQHRVHSRAARPACCRPGGGKQAAGGWPRLWWPPLASGRAGGQPGGPPRGGAVFPVAGGRRGGRPGGGGGDALGEC